jgi:arylformamidase
MDHPDAAELERQYDNRARVPAHPQILASWAERSEQVRRSIQCELDVPYGTSPSETLDIFPAARAGSPVLVFIHGGYWRALDKADHSFIAPPFVDAGATVIVPNYGLCPAVDIGTIAVQMARAIAWMWRNAARYGGDPERIVVAGHSAGGHLATMLLCCHWRSVEEDLPKELVSRALSISGLYDLGPLRHVAFLQKDLRLDDDQVRRLSPVCFPKPRGRLLTAVGAVETDEFRRQNRLMRAAWGSTAVPQVLEVPEANHFTVLHELADPAALLHRTALDWLGLARKGSAAPSPAAPDPPQPAASR